MSSDLGRVRFSSALMVAMTLKLFAVVTLVVTLLAVGRSLGDTTDTATQVAAIGVGVGGVLVGALLAAVGFGINILVDSYTVLADIRINTEMTADFISTGDFTASDAE